MFTVGSLSWLYFNYKGAEEGGYPEYIEDFKSKWSNISQEQIKLILLP